MHVPSSTSGASFDPMNFLLRRAVERHPLLWAAGLAVAAVVAADGWWLLGGLVFAGLAGCLGRVGKWRMLAACVGLALVAAGLHYRELARRDYLTEEMGTGKYGPVVARLLEQPRSAGRGWAALVELENSGDRVWIRAQGRGPEKGAVVTSMGRYLPIRGPRNPGEFDVRPWLARQGAFAVFKTEGSVDLLRGPPPWMTWGQQRRVAFRESVTRGLDPLSREAAVIRAVVLGERPGDDMLIEPFRRTGTLHVFAVSGLHVGMVGLLGWMLLRALGVPRRVAVLPLIAMMFGYAWLTGMKPPAVRAAWMATVIMGAFWFRRRPDLLNALGLAALSVALFDGDMLFRVGVQLSFGVVLVIGLLHRRVGRLFRWMEVEEPYLPRSLYGRWREAWLRFRRGLADLLTVSTSAWIGSAPLTAYYFGLVTPISVVASVVLSMGAFAMLALALSAVLLSPLPMVSEWINRGNGWVARRMLGSAELGARVPGGNFSLPRGRPGKEFLLIYDLGDGGAACWHGPGTTLMIDGGDRRDFERVLLPSLRWMALRPEAFVATHPDGGHMGGLIEALDAFPIEKGLMPVLRARSPNFRDLLLAADTRAVPLIRGRTDQRYALDEAGSLEVLWEPDPWNWSMVADERVMPLRLDWRGWKILFVADSGWAAEHAMLESGVDLQADVIVAGRHIHDASLGRRFLDAVGARVIIASHADFPTEERIPESWRGACEARGIEVFHQGECGAVTLVLDEGDLKIRAFLGDKEVILSEK